MAGASSDSHSEPKQSGSLTTAIHLPRGTWELLRKVAFHRAEKDGGRASVSRLITTLVESNREQLEREVE
jgi:hypothetical protein